MQDLFSDLDDGTSSPACAKVSLFCGKTIDLSVKKQCDFREQLKRKYFEQDPDSERVFCFDGNFGLVRKLSPGEPSIAPHHANVFFLLST